MAETKLSIKGKVFVQLDGSEEQYEVGTVEIPFNVNFAEGRVAMRPIGERSVASITKI